MTINDSIQWLTNLHEAMGDAQYQGLWHFEQALVETIELLKATAEQTPVLKPGDTVYRLRSRYTRGYPWEIDEGVVDTIVQHTIKTEHFVKYYVNFDGGYSEFKASDIGVVFFLTKDEAEARLREAISGVSL